MPVDVESTEIKSGTMGWYLEWFKRQFERFYEITAAKNADYSTGGDASRSAFDNFEHLEKMSHGAALTSHGFLFRLSDKWTRIVNIIMNEDMRAVKGETVDDTIDDMIIYLMLFKAWRLHKRESAKGR